jgi:hypothetical protein
MALSLKPNEELMVSAISAGIVYSIFQLDAPNLADVRATTPGGAQSQNIHGSVKTAVYTSAAVIGGISILAKSPTVFVVGGVMIVAEAWKYYHANLVHPASNSAKSTAAQISNS